MAKRWNNESSIGTILGEIISTNKLQAGIDQVEVRTAWTALMGNGVNNYTRNVLLKNDVLYVELSSAVLREELGFGRTKIVKMINDELGRELIKSLVLR